MSTDESKPLDISAEKLAEFREIFALVDKDGGGAITGDELATLMNTLGIDTSPEEIEQMIEELDQDSNGEIDFDEFVAVMGRKVSASFTSTQVKASFKLFEDGAEDGKISVDSLISALTNYGTTKLSLDEASELVNQLEPDGRGMIDYKDYISMMME